MAFFEVKCAQQGTKKGTGNSELPGRTHGGRGRPISRYDQDVEKEPERCRLTHCPLSGHAIELIEPAWRAPCNGRPTQMAGAYEETGETVAH